MKLYIQILILLCLAPKVHAQQMPEITPALITYVETTCGDKFEKVWRKKHIHVVETGEYAIYQRYNGTTNVWEQYVPKSGTSLLVYKKKYFYSLTDNTCVYKVPSDKKVKTSEEKKQTGVVVTKIATTAANAAERYIPGASQVVAILLPPQ